MEKEHIWQLDTRCDLIGSFMLSDYNLKSTFETKKIQLIYKNLHDEINSIIFQYQMFSPDL